MKLFVISAILTLTCVTRVKEEVKVFWSWWSRRKKHCDESANVIFTKKKETNKTIAKHHWPDLRNSYCRRRVVEHENRNELQMLGVDHQRNKERPKSPRERAKPVVVSHNDQQGPPLDFSFKNIETLESLKTEKPRRGSKNYKKNKEGKYSCVSLRLNNNYLQHIGGIHSIALDAYDWLGKTFLPWNSGRYSAFFEDQWSPVGYGGTPVVECDNILEAPEKLTWLDLSFNRLTSIPAEITALNSLKIIYLHGNHLVDLAAVLRPLKMLDGLYSLTLHGNPVEERDNYRYKVMAHLPHLKTLDFNKITSADRKKAENMKKKH